MKPNLGKIIKEFRLKKNMSRKDLAKILGHTYATISHWENGKRGLKTYDFLKISQILDINTQIFLQAMEKQSIDNDVLPL